MPSSCLATSHHAAAAMRLLGSHYSHLNPPLLAEATGWELLEDLQLPLPICCGRWSTCSVCVRIISWKQFGPMTTSTQSTSNFIASETHPRSTHTTTSQKNLHWPWTRTLSKRDKYYILYRSVQYTLLKTQEHLPTISLFARHALKWAFFKFLQVALRSFCHAAAGIWEQS